MAAPEPVKFTSIAESGEWRDMVRLFLDRGEPLNQAVQFADSYILAVRARSQKPEAPTY